MVCRFRGDGIRIATLRRISWTAVTSVTSVAPGPALSLSPDGAPRPPHMAQPSLEMLASMPDKPPLPKKPRAPKRVASEADNAVRQAEHTRAVAEYERQMELHRILMHERKTQQMATRRAQLAAAEPLDARRATHDAPGLPAHSTEPAAVTVALPVAPPKRVRRVWNGNTRPRVHSHEPRTSLAMRPDGRHPAWARWADDVSRKMRCIRRSNAVPVRALVRPAALPRALPR